MRVMPVTAPLIVAAACVTAVACTSASTSSASASPKTSAAPSPVRYADWPSYHQNSLRTGVSPDMPSTISSARVLTSIKLDGAVYGSPIVAAGRTIVVTENDSVYAFDASYHQLWMRHLGTPAPGSQLPCGDIKPLGITGTPVYDGAHQSVYLAAETSGAPPKHTLFSLNVVTGATRWSRSVDLSGVDPAAMQERGALALAAGRVLVPFGGLDGDCGAYKGRVVGVPETGSGATIAYTVPTAREAGIWTPPGPTVDAAHGRILVSVGNGASGVGDDYDFSDSVLALSGTLKLADSFSPTTWPTDNDSDLDLGSQGPAIAGNYVFSAGKSGTAYVLRRTDLGGIGGQVHEGTVCHSFGGTAVAGTVVFVPCTDGLRAVQIYANGVMHVLWHTASSVNGSPVIGANRVWTLDTGAGVLRGLFRTSGYTNFSVKVGATNRFATPAIHGPDVLVPTLTGLTVVRTS